MGLIRSGNTQLTPKDDEELKCYLWSIVCGMIKTAVENRQNLIVEGLYVPLDWKKDFDEWDLQEIKYFCFVMSKKYIEKHFDDIKAYAGIIEQRLDDSDCTKESVLENNLYNLEMCRKHDCNYILIDDEYRVEIEL